MTSNLLSYKGYLGSIEYSAEDKCLYGKVKGIRSLLLYEGDTIKKLKEDFQEAVDDYLDMCASKSIQPEKTSYDGLRVM